MYKNSGGIYAGFKNYWFRVTAYSKAGHAESEISHEFVPKFAQDFGFIGMFDYWASVPVLNGTVNATNGNFIMSEKDITLSGRDRMYQWKERIIAKVKSRFIWYRLV